MFFDGWSDILRILVIGPLTYGGLVAVLRFSGKRTLAKMNAFDLVVTVALGSTLATALLSKDISLAEGIFACALLCFLQFIVAFSAVRWPHFRDVIKSEPNSASLAVQKWAPRRRMRLGPVTTQLAILRSGVASSTGWEQSFAVPQVREDNWDF